MVRAFVFLGRILGGTAALALALTSIAEASYLVPFPSLLLPALDAMPVIFGLHMIAAALAVGTVMASLAVQRPPVYHRAIGRAAASLALVALVTAIPVAVQGASRPQAKAGFIAQAVLCTWFLGRGIAHARAGRASRHARAMRLMSAAGFGAVVSRVLLQVPDPWLAPASHYAMVAWAAWLVPVAITLMIENRKTSRDRVRDDRPGLQMRRITRTFLAGS